MNVTKVSTKEYGKMSNWAIYPKQTQFKAKQTQFPINELRTPNYELITIKPNFTSAQKSIKAARPRFPAFPSHLYVNEREQKNHSRLPLIEPICPCRWDVCLRQMPVLKEKCVNNELFTGNAEKLVLDKPVKWAIIKLYWLGWDDYLEFSL